MAFVKIPEEAGLEPMAIRVESIDVLSYPRRSNEGFYFTFTIMIAGARIEPRFTKEEDCVKFHKELKGKLGI